MDAKFLGEGSSCHLVVWSKEVGLMGHLRGLLKHLSMDWSRGYFSALKKAPTASQRLFARKCVAMTCGGPFFGGHSKLNFHLFAFCKGPVDGFGTKKAHNKLDSIKCFHQCLTQHLQNEFPNPLP